MLEDGNLERFEAGKRDPALVAFVRYAFDMSKFSNRGRDVTLGIRERYVWELLAPSPEDPVYKQVPGQFRAELHDRFMAPIYPFAFAALTSRSWDRRARRARAATSRSAVRSWRCSGCASPIACWVLTVRSPLAAVAQYRDAVPGDRRRDLDDPARRGGGTARGADGNASTNPTNVFLRLFGRPVTA